MPLVRLDPPSVAFHQTGAAPCPSSALASHSSFPKSHFLNSLVARAERIERSRPRSQAWVETLPSARRFCSVAAAGPLRTSTGSARRTAAIREVVAGRTRPKGLAGGCWRLHLHLLIPSLTIGLGSSASARCTG